MKKSYSAKDVANLLNCSIAVVYSYEKRGYLKRKVEGELSGVRFEKADVDRLSRDKKVLDSAGKSFSTLAKELNIHPGTVSEIVTSLNLNVKQVPISLYANRQRYAITSSQEQKIIQYLKEEKKSTRPKRNYLYYTHMDRAYYQLFLLNGSQEVRLIEGEGGKMGFYVDKNNFVTYVEANKKFNLIPKYSIHKSPISHKKNKTFTDLVVPLTDKKFPLVLDTLYSVCGIENFNAKIHNNQIFASVRNGSYILPVKKLKNTVNLLNQYSIFGEIRGEEDQLVFSRSLQVVEIQLDKDTYEALNNVERKSRVSLDNWIQECIRESLNRDDS